MNNQKGSHSTRDALIGLIAIVICCLCILLIAFPGFNQFGSSETSVIEKPTEQILSSDPHRAMEQILNSVLGSGNRHVQRLAAVSWNGDTSTLNIQWAIDDNFSDALVKRSAMLDIEHMLEAISKNRVSYDYRMIAFSGTFPLTDVYGNSAEEQVVSAIYSRATLAKINWESFITDNIYIIADSVWLSPSFR